jgi:hypothetical protein
MPKWIGDWLESSAGPRLRVLETVYVTPAIKKIRFQGNISKMNFLVGGASVIRVSETEYRNYTVSSSYRKGNFRNPFPYTWQRSRKPVYGHFKNR